MAYVASKFSVQSETKPSTYTDKKPMSYNAYHTVEYKYKLIARSSITTKEIVQTSCVCCCSIHISSASIKFIFNLHMFEFKAILLLDSLFLSVLGYRANGTLRAVHAQLKIICLCFGSRHHFSLHRKVSIVLYCIELKQLSSPTTLARSFPIFVCSFVCSVFNNSYTIVYGI